MGDYVVWFRDGSTWTHPRFGDYVTVRRAAPESRMFAGFGFVTVDTSTAAGAAHRFDRTTFSLDAKKRTSTPGLRSWPARSLAQAKVPIYFLALSSAGR